jgi:YidC/Oxa1 family membrane protein insertase
MDKQSRLGMLLLFALLAGYLWYNQSQESKYFEKKKQDSIANAKLNPPVLQAKKDTIAIVSKTDSFVVAATPEQEFVLENKVAKFIFTNKGAMLRQVELKLFKTAKKFVANQQEYLSVFNKNQHSTDVFYKATNGSMVHTKDIVFSGTKTGNTISFIGSEGQSISYSLPDSSYMLDVSINANNTVDASNTMSLEWSGVAPNTEYDASSELQYNKLAYNETKEGTDYFTITSEKKKEFTDGLKYLSFKQHYFNTSIVKKDKDFGKVTVTASPTNDTSNSTIAKMQSVMQLAAGQQFNYQMYCGPNDYTLLKSYNIDLEKIIPLEYTSWLGFIRYLNIWIIMPLFNLLSSFISNYGIVILILTLIVRLLMSPITYKSYLSAAKMKALKPELDELRAKYGDDQQQMGVKQMELYRSTGVNMLGGCIPSLLQLPIFFALLSFFPNAIQLRQQNFLWAKDLSTFDVILKLPFSIPAYGNHVSLWTLLFVATSLILAVTSMSSQPTDNSNPALKYMPFIMPIIFLGVFNKLPAALTFYYVVSNLITIGLQWFIQNKVIDHNKIKAQIEEHRTKGPKTNKFMERMAEMQKENEERRKKMQKK